jgi:hypothetical protein
MMLRCGVNFFSKHTVSKLCKLCCAISMRVFIFKHWYHDTYMDMYMYVIDSMQAIEVTQNESLKRSLNDLLETLPGGGIVQARSGSTVWRNITQ